MSELKKTILYSWHKEHGQIVDFAGWAMPVRYSDITTEHMAVRENCGIFDVSHMGRIWIRGPGAFDLLDTLVVRDLSKVKENQAAYSFMLNERAGFRDDVIVTKFTDEEWLLVCNAGNLDKIWEWVQLHGKNFDVQLENKSAQSAMFAVQGPKAREIISSMTDDELPGRFRAGWITLDGQKVLFSGTGYTGEDGGEIALFDDSEELESKALKLWQSFIDKGAEPCALGARDTLRLEAGYSLYGNDMDEDTHVLESSLAFVPFAHIHKDRDYIGKEATLAKEGKEEKFRVFFKLVERGVARHGYPVIVDGEEAGVVTSGTRSPLTKEFIGMAYIPYTLKEVGSRFHVQVKRKVLEAEVIPFPIYDTKKYGYARES